MSEEGNVSCCNGAFALQFNKRLGKGSQAKVYRGINTRTNE